MVTKTPRRLVVVDAATPPPPLVESQAVIELLRSLHTPVTVCRGCCSTTCSGQCHWADEYGGELLTICSHCCLDPYEQKQNYPCLDEHPHGAEYETTAVCATTAILDGDTTWFRENNPPPARPEAT